MKPDAESAGIPHSKAKELFYGQGYCVIEKLFSSHELDPIRESFDRLYQTAQKLEPVPQLHKGAHFVLGGSVKGSKENVVKRIVWAGAAEQALLKISEDKRIIELVAEILGSRTFEQLINQAHFKMPADNVSFDWHQDIQHRNKGPGTWSDINAQGSYVQTLLLVDEMTNENGPLLIIPGSNHFGRLDFGSDAGAAYGTDPNADSDGRERKAILPKQIASLEQKPIIAPAGSVLFFGPYTVHGSFANNSLHTRRVLINGYAYPGANKRVYPGLGSGRTLIAR